MTDAMAGAVPAPSTILNSIFNRLLEVRAANTDAIASLTKTGDRLLGTPPPDPTSDEAKRAWGDGEAGDINRLIDEVQEQTYRLNSHARRIAQV